MKPAATAIRTGFAVVPRKPLIHSPVRHSRFIISPRFLTYTAGSPSDIHFGRTEAERFLLAFLGGCYPTRVKTVKVIVVSEPSKHV